MTIATLPDLIDATIATSEELIVTEGLPALAKKIPAIASVAKVIGELASA